MVAACASGAGWREAEEERETPSLSEGQGAHMKALDIEGKHGNQAGVHMARMCLPEWQGAHLSLHEVQGAHLSLIVGHT